MSNVLISVVIPSYNYAHTLRRAVLSVTQQLSSSAELLVIDDGSTDNTPELVESILNELGPAFRYIRKTNGGLASVRNRGIDEARGRFLIFLDADDEMSQNALSNIEAHIAANPMTKMVIGGHIAVSPDGKRRTHMTRSLPNSSVDRLRAYLFKKNLSLANGACVMHREVFERGRYPEGFRSAEDIPVFVQVLANCECTVLSLPLAIIHKHEDSLRHQFSHAHRIGMSLVDEVFTPARIDSGVLILKNEYYVQRSLSLFRSAYLAREFSLAKQYYKTAVRRDARVLLRWTYLRKALRLWLKRVR